MIRQKLEEYLDGGLDARECAAVERQILDNVALGRLLVTLKQQRAQRAAVYAEYAPSEGEAHALSAKILAACAEEAAAPVGRIGPWVRSAGAIAAMLALVIGGFAAGRMTSVTPGRPPLVAVQPVEVIRVMYSDDAGEPQMKEFSGMEEANAFCKEMTALHAEPVVVANGLDTDHPGSF